MLIKKRAFDLFEIAAKEGNSNAQGLAYLYEKGERTEKNIDKSVNLQKMDVLAKKAN
jgi:TPR repeat protein